MQKLPTDDITCTPSTGEMVGWYMYLICCAVVVIVDVSNKWTREKLDPVVLHALRSYPHIPATLVLNKVECSFQRRLREWRGWGWGWG